MTYMQPITHADRLFTTGFFAPPTWTRLHIAQGIYFCFISFTQRASVGWSRITTSSVSGSFTSATSHATATPITPRCPCTINWIMKGRTYLCVFFPQEGALHWCFTVSCIPGSRHGSGLQSVSVSTPSPIQNRSPLVEVGSMQFLFLVLSPSPHVTLQFDHSLHVDHLASSTVMQIDCRKTSFFSNTIA